jgi:hypothetical protein
VADQQQCHLPFGAKLTEQFEYLLLVPHVQGGGRLVGDEQPRAGHQRHGDHNPLAHAAGELARVGVQPPGGAGHAHPVEQFHRPSPGRGPADAAGGEHLLELAAEGDHRIEGRQRVLQHQADDRAADVPHAAQGRPVGDPVDAHRATHHGPAGQAEGAERQRALTGTRLADDADPLAGGDGQVHAVHGPVQSAIGPRVADSQVLQVENGGRDRTHGRCLLIRTMDRTRGSSWLRSRSPSRLKLIAVRVSARPGKTATHQDEEMVWVPS